MKTLNLKFEDKTSVTRQIEVELPYYCKDGRGEFYCVHSEEDIITVTNRSGLVFIDNHVAMFTHKRILNAEISSKEEFTEAFDKAFNKLQNQVDKLGRGSEEEEEGIAMLEEKLQS